MNKLKAQNHSKHLVMLLTALTLILLGGVNKAQAQWTTNGNDINNTNTGNVGIGTGTTTPPLERLHVSGGSGTYTAIRLSDTATGGGNWDIASTDNANGAGGGLFGIYDLNNSAYRFAINQAGNVGIGTTNPGSRLEVTGSTLIERLTNTNAGTYGILGFFEGSTEKSHIGVVGSASNGYVGGPNAFQVWNFANAPIVFGTNGAERVRIDGSGYVGIGTATPSTKLDVNGNANVTGNITVTGTGTGNITASGTITGGNIQATYQDVAEWVPSTHALPAGTVVIINPTKSNEVMASTSAYDTRVAGVVSERPGLALGEAGKDKALVATTGRVKVKVDATRAPIHVGDLLVTSDVEGVAMKSEPVDVGGVKLHRPGTLIGKALENLEKGTGEILVLLSLQ